MNLKKQSFLIILIGFFIQSYGQNGVFSTKTKWKRLKTKTFDIITPNSQIYAGYKIMQYLHQFQQEDSLLGHYRDKRTYIIYGDHAISNGFVAPGPYRSGLFLTPPQSNFIGPGSWVKNLVNHENHHFVQHADARQSALKFSFQFLGDFADSFLSNVYLLGWYWEGDAVFRESYANKYGRGNYSHFLNKNRLFTQQNLRYNSKRFTYAYNRPFNAYIPNHYNLGYEMVQYLGKSNPEDLYHSVDNTVGQLKRLPRQIKKHTGKSLFQHYELALDSIRREDSKMDYLKPKSILPEDKAYIHQTSITDKKSPFYIQQSFLEPAKVYHNNKPLFTLGASPDGVHRIQNNTDYIVWNELRTHPNFSTETYSVLMVWDIPSSKKIQLTKIEKAFSPTIHPKQSKVAYLELESDYTFLLKEIDLSTKEVRTLLNTESDYLRNLNYSEDGQYLTYIDQKTDVQTLCVYNFGTNQLETYNIPHLYQISNAFLTQDYTFVLTADYNNYEYIYLYNPKINALKRSTQVSSAFKHIQVKGQSMTFDYETLNGRRNGTIDLNTLIYTNEGLPRVNTVNTHKHVFDTVAIETVDYKTGFPRLKFHSVLPFVSTQDIQIELHANDFLRKNQFLYRFYQNYGSENSVHQALYTYAHFPVHLSGIFTHSSSGTRNMYTNNRLITSFQENKFGAQLSYPNSIIKSGYTIQHIPSVEWSYRSFEADSVNTYYGSSNTNIDVRNTFYIAKNRGPVALASPLYATMTNRFASDFKEAYITEHNLKVGVNILNHSHFLEAEVGLVKEHVERYMYRYGHEVVLPSTGYFLTTSSLGFNNQSLGVFLSDYSTHIKVNMKNTIAYPNMRLTDFVFLKRIWIEPFIEQSTYRLNDGNEQSLRSFGSHIAFDIQWVKSLPVQLRLTYAQTPDLRSNSSFIGFGLVF